MCLEGASGAGAELLAAMPDSDVRAYYVWVPMLPSDNATAAGRVSRRLAEPRAKHYWDGDRLLSRRIAVELGIDSRRSAGGGDEPPFAWDVYLAYRRGNRDNARPDFWMHQLAVDHAPHFNAAEWRRRITEMFNDGRMSGEPSM
jgi:hypothetical protein